jgi:ribosomal protein S1
MPTSYNVGEIVEGTFSKYTPFGWFVKLYPDQKEALLHVSEVPLSDDYLNPDPLAAYRPGQAGNFLIKELFEMKGREVIRLSFCFRFQIVKKCL